MKFKKGDRVRILGRTFSNRDLKYTRMEVGDIKVIDEADYHENAYNINSWYFNEQDLELVEKPVKVGDVIIKASTYFTVIEVLENIFSLRDIGYSSVHWMTFEELKEKLEDGEWRIEGEEKEVEVLCPHCNKKLI